MAFLTSASLLVFAISLPPPQYGAGDYIGREANHKYMLGIYPANIIGGRLTTQQLATLAFLAGRQLRRMSLGDPNLLASHRKPGTISVWQARNDDVWIASSDGNFVFEGHAERNIIRASHGNIRGGRVISYTWNGGTKGLRDSCTPCKDKIREKGSARDVFQPGIIPDHPPLPEGWNARVNWHSPFL